MEEEKGRRAMGNLLAIVVAIAAVGSVIFAGWQTRISRATAELQFEATVVTRLDDLLFKVANAPDSRRVVWGEHAEENRLQVASQALANMLTVALVAVDRLPGFEQNRDAWYKYTESMLERSPGVLEEILTHPDWWRATVPIAKKVKAAQEPSAADGNTPVPGLTIHDGVIYASGRNLRSGHRPKVVACGRTVR